MKRPCTDRRRKAKLSNLSTKKDSVVEIRILYIQLRQNRITGNNILNSRKLSNSEITVMRFERDSTARGLIGTARATANSMLKIFDFEVLP